MPTTIVTTADRLTPDVIRAIASDLSLTERVVRYPRQQDRSQYVIGRVLVQAFDEPKSRDLGEGPSWQEKYILPMDVYAEIMWEPSADQELSVSFPVTSLLREGGAKLAGVSVSVRDDTDPKPSIHRHCTWEYHGAKEIGTKGTLFGHMAWLVRGVSVREAPYDHDPSASRWVIDFTHTRY